MLENSLHTDPLCACLKSKRFLLLPFCGPLPFHRDLKYGPLFESRYHGVTMPLRIPNEKTILGDLLWM